MVGSACVICRLDNVFIERVKTGGKMEILFVILSWLKPCAAMLAVLSVIFPVLSYLIPAMGAADHLDLFNFNNPGSKEVFKQAWKWTTIFIFCFSISSMPNVNDLWKIRIGLLKYSLASEENVSKGVSEIKRIADKLEKKYLGN